MRSLVAIVLLTAAPALPCEPAPALDPNGADFFEEQRSAPAGALWWTTGQTALRLSPPNEDVAIEQVIDGPNVDAWRVPDLPPGNVDTNRGTFTIDDSALAARDAPVLQDVTSTEQREVRLNGECNVGFSERHDTSFTDVVLTIDTAAPTASLRFDTWVLIEGDAPEENAPRYLEMHSGTELAVTDDDAVVVRVEHVGAFDVHVRVRDAESGAASEIVGVHVENDAASFAGWDLGGGWHWGCASTGGGAPMLSFAIVLLSFRRRVR